MDDFCPYAYRKELVEKKSLSERQAIIESRVQEMRLAKLKAATRKEIPSAQFAVPGKRKLPIHDCSHARNAKARLNQTQGLTSQEKTTALAKINAKLKKCGAEIGSLKGEK